MTFLLRRPFREAGTSNGSQSFERLLFDPCPPSESRRVVASRPPDDASNPCNCLVNWHIGLCRLFRGRPLRSGGSFAPGSRVLERSECVHACGVRHGLVGER